MKKNLTFILFFSAVILSVAQDNKRGLNIQVMEDRSRRPGNVNDSILSASIDNNIIKKIIKIENSKEIMFPLRIKIFIRKIKDGIKYLNSKYLWNK